MSVHLKNGPPLSRSLCLKIARFLKLGAAAEELSAFNIWPSLNIEPTLSQISEEILESLKLCERNSRKNFERQTAPSSQQPTKGIPRVTSRDDDMQDSVNQPGNETTDQRHFNLKQVSNNLYSLELVVFISKVKILDFSS